MTGSNTLVPRNIWNIQKRCYWSYKIINSPNSYHKNKWVKGKYFTHLMHTSYAIYIYKQHDMSILKFKIRQYTSVIWRLWGKETPPAKKCIMRRNKLSRFRKALVYKEILVSQKFSHVFLMRYKMQLQNVLMLSNVKPNITVSSRNFVNTNNADHMCKTCVQTTLQTFVTHWGMLTRNNKTLLHIQTKIYGLVEFIELC